MYDPLSTSSAAAFAESSTAPPWPTTPHSPETLNAPLVRKVPSLDKLHEASNGRQPQIYGQPTPGLISPETSTFSNGSKLVKSEPYLRVRITGLDRNRRDILIRFDAQTSLPNFNGTTYRNVSRSYVECQRFAEQIVYNNPQTIIPALPLPQTSAPTDEEDDRLVKVMLQRWFSRICEDPVLLPDEEVRSFIESDFGYQPTVRQRRKASSGFNLLRRGPPDEDEELQSARFELTRLEGQFFEAAKAIDKLSKARKALSTAHAEMGNKLVGVATTEAHVPLGNAFRKFGRAWHSIGDNDLTHSTGESVILGDSLGYQAINSRAAKETLLQRTQVLDEYQVTVKSTIAKRRHIERLKASSNIRPEKVDEAIEDMDEALQVEKLLARRVNGISQNLHKALSTHSRHAHEDLTASLIEHARASLLFERKLKRELEALRPDIRAINRPQPQSIPPRHSASESFSTVRPSADGAPATPQTPRPELGYPSRSAAVHPNRDQGPLGDGNTRAGPSSPANQNANVVPDYAGQRSPPPPSSPRTSVNGGGRVMDGSKSMFINHASASSMPTSSYDRAPPTDPLAGRPIGGSSGNLRQQGSSSNMAAGSSGADPLGGMQTSPMAQSMFVQPARNRIDQREAARKLANLF